MIDEMHAILFAGGVGQRLWPLSRQKSPKQFSPLIGSKSSFQIAAERLTSLVAPDHIFVATNQKYLAILREQAPEIPAVNFIAEPARRDVAAAVALAFFSLEKDGHRGPVLFQWTDNYVKNTDQLLASIEVGRKLIKVDPQRLVFIGEKPRFANENLGWIELGEDLGKIDDVPYYSFRSWHYRPPKEICEAMFASGNFVWNSGFFVTSVEFMVSAFRSLAAELASIIEEIVSHRGTSREQEILDELYPTVPALHFDEAILVRLPKSEAVLLRVDLGWSDPGSLYALKEALEDAPDANVSRGNVVSLQMKDSLIYNDDSNKLVATMGLEGVVVVEMGDVTLVIHKDSVRHIGKLLDRLVEEGWGHLL